MTPQEAEQLAARVLEWADSDESVEVVISSTDETELRVYEQQVESFSSASTAGVGIRVIADQRVGFAHCAAIGVADLEETLRQARENARFGSRDPHAVLAEPDGVVPVDFVAVSTALSQVPVEDKIDRALALEARALALDPRISIESCDYGDAFGVSAVASTAGILASTEESVASLSLYCLATDDTETTTGFGFDWSVGFDDIDIDQIAADAVQRAVEMFGARPISSRRMTVVFDPWVTSQFLGVLGQAFSGSEVVRGRSLFGGRVGELVAGANVNLVDDPTDVRWFGASKIDGEGIATRRVRLISDGALEGFVFDASSASASGPPQRSTGSALRAGYRSSPVAGTQSLVLEGGSGDLASLSGSVGDAILVREVQGLHSGVNPISGDFSTGIEGRMIRNGQLAEPIREVTMASTLQAMLLDVRAVGADHVAVPGDAVGCTLVVDNVSISGSDS